jgi:hypothetical protein
VLIWWRFLFIVLLLSTGVADARFPHGTPFDIVLKPLKIGAGGFISGIDIQCDQGVGACNGTPERRRYVTNPIIANPISSIAHVDGSGTEDGGGFTAVLGMYGATTLPSSITPPSMANPLESVFPPKRK